MRIHADLHAHSAFAGGARAGGVSQHEREKKIIKRFHDSALYSPLKGVNLLGTGDIQFEPWLDFIEKNFIEIAQGIFQYDAHIDFRQNRIIPPDFEYQPPNYLLQTELIFTGPVVGTEYKKQVHVVFTFPHFTAVKELNELLDRWEVARQNMARPFITNETTEEVDQKLNAILDIDPYVEAIPAHVLTPSGIYGGNLRINYLEDYFGSSAGRINAIETGLSADPSILGLIPELDNKTLISNADAHSAKLNRIGREFTTLATNNFDYQSIISAIRSNQVVKTAEFHPTEGRYFLTGHRENRNRPGNHEKNQYCFFSPQHTPIDDMCPQCGGELTIGVLQRAYEIAKQQGEERKIGSGPPRNFVTMIPLVEIVAHALEMKTLTSKRVLKTYSQVIGVTGSEVNLWLDDKIDAKLEDSILSDNLIQQILMVKAGNFSFFPGGYDGQYGELRIGEILDFEDISVINN